MSLGIKLDVVKGLGHGQAGDRVARVIFRGDFQLTYLLGPKMVNDHVDRYCVVPGVSKATKVFEQRGDTCFINQVRCFVMAACGMRSLKMKEKLSNFIFILCNLLTIMCQIKAMTYASSTR